MPISYLYRDKIESGSVTQVTDGIFWIKLPVPMAVDHINVYLLEGGDGWTLVDTGVNAEPCKQLLVDTLNSAPFNDKPLTQVIATHFHPDHIGLAGHFTKYLGAGDAPPLLTSRTTWHAARGLCADDLPTPSDANISFYLQAGMKQVELEAFKRSVPSNYPRQVLPLPRSYQRLCEGQEIAIGSRKWTVRMGYGHADEHVTLWSDDNIALVGDQILPSISPNLSVHFSEPEADCVAAWLKSCAYFERISNESLLTLPGHNGPFTGAPDRCAQLIRNCSIIIGRIEGALNRSKTAIDLMPDIYRRPLAANERMALIGESMAYLNHLHASGRIARRISSTGSYVWRKS